MICRLITVQRYNLFLLKTKIFRYIVLRFLKKLFTDYQYIKYCFIVVFIIKYDTLEVRELHPFLSIYYYLVRSSSCLR